MLTKSTRPQLRLVLPVEMKIPTARASNAVARWRLWMAFKCHYHFGYFCRALGTVPGSVLTHRSLALHLASNQISLSDRETIEMRCSCFTVNRRSIPCARVSFNTSQHTSSRPSRCTCLTSILNKRKRISRDCGRSRAPSVSPACFSGARTGYRVMWIRSS